ncbi:hypothetical protein Ancab_001988 [Ancistrocladus abbreviatus]
MHLFDVADQYRAIFVDDTSQSEQNCDSWLLFSWSMDQITSHLKTLTHMLPKITECRSLLNILDQCMVAFPHCTKCFGRGYPGGAAFIGGAKNSFDGISRLLSVSLSRERPRPKPIINTGGIIVPENANLLVVENGLSPPVGQKEDDVNDKELSSDNSGAEP